jgi:hypothetical protein
MFYRISKKFILHINFFYIHLHKIKLFKIMKKIFLFVAVVSAFSLASCKKDRVCTCTTTYADGSVGDPYIVTFTDAKKSAAKANCLSTSETDWSGTGTQKTKCDLN